MSDDAGDARIEAIGGDARARDELFELLYEDLHARAHRERSRHSPSTLSTTALVHEAYVKLFDRPINVESREHFFHVAARAMRQILVDHVRHRNREKRGGGVINVALSDDIPIAQDSPVALIALDTALVALHAFDAKLAKLAELHVFAGLEFKEIAELTGTSERSIYRDWRMARVFLCRNLEA